MIASGGVDHDAQDFSIAARALTLGGITYHLTKLPPGLHLLVAANRVGTFGAHFEVRPPSHLAAVASWQDQEN